jgi:pyrroloquinoline quinone biosynthesis protein E
VAKFNHPSLRHLTVKPFHGCSHHCPYCDSRQELFRQSRDATMGLDDWAEVFRDAHALGNEYLDISGGEPTLYKALPGMIWEGKRLGWYVSINSTGFAVPEMLDRLVAVCLDQVIVSLVSLDAEKHDRLRHTEGSWGHAHRAIRAVRGSGLRLILHFIVNRHNYQELPELLDFAFEEGANGLALVYPENDHQERYLLLTEADINDFRSRVLPLTLAKYRKRYANTDRSHQNLDGLFVGQGDAADYSAGTYWKDFEEIQSRCNKPNMFALIYANGDVMPCNAIEYTHAPIVGNVVRERLTDIWQGEAWEKFRRDRMPFCRLCPIMRHTGVGIATTDNPPYAAPIELRVPERLPAERPPAPVDFLKTRFPRRYQAPPSPGGGCGSAPALVQIPSP